MKRFSCMLKIMLLGMFLSVSYSETTDSAEPSNKTANSGVNDSKGTSPVKFRCETLEGVTGLGYLSWDTEGGNRVEENLLLPNSGVSLYAHVGDDWNLLKDVTVTQDATAGTIRQESRLSPETLLTWVTTVAQSNAVPEGKPILSMQFSLNAPLPAEMTGFRLLLPFNPQ